MAPPAPSPSHIIRSHGAQVSTISFSTDNERIYSGDVNGTVIVTSTRTLRSIAAWKAHSDGILGVEEWLPNLITHGRDNKLHVWSAVLELETIAETAVRDGSLITPELRYSLDVNALNFCRFSLCPYITQHETSSGSASSSTSSADDSRTALLAVPNLVESSFADVWELPSRERLHAAIGKGTVINREGDSGVGQGETKSGIIMTLELFSVKVTQPSVAEILHLLVAYESGAVALYRCSTPYAEKSIEGRGWTCVWRTRQHAESVMGLAISPDKAFALTVSADHLIVRYNLFEKDEESHPRFVKFRTKQVGNAAITIRDDGRVCAVGGWDGKVRLFSTKSMKPLGTLSYHTKSCKGLAFAHQMETHDELDDDELTTEEKKARALWLVAGSEDSRLSLWQLMSFRKD